MAAKRRKNDETIDKVYKLLVDEVLPVKDDIAGIQKDIKRINGSFEKRCRIVDKQLDNHDNEIKDKIGWKLFTVITGIVAGLIIIFNVIDYIIGT